MGKILVHTTRKNYVGCSSDADPLESDTPSTANEVHATAEKMKNTRWSDQATQPEKKLSVFDGLLE